MRTNRELALSEARLREAERIIGVGSWELDPDVDGLLTYSPGFARVIGLAPGEPLTLAQYQAILHREDRSKLAEAINDCVRTGSASCEYRIVRPDGSVRWLAAQGETVPETSLLRGAILDVTERRDAERQRIAATALFEQAFDAAPIAMCLTSPNNRLYLRVNDAMCALLGRSRAELMQLRVEDVTHPDDRGRDHEQLKAILRGDLSSYQLEKRYFRPDGSLVWAEVHVGPVRNAEGDIEALFAQKIDITEAKEREAHLAGYVRDAEWLARIRDALDDDRFTLYSQPIIDLRTGKTVQRELLLRMRDEDGTVVAPGEFLPIAERYGLISEIDRWVIRKAVGLARTAPVEFNLSAASIGDPDVMRELTSAIETTGVDPAQLVVEVTETAIMDQAETGRAFAERLRELGCQLALDDFGTGFAGLSYLKHFSADHLKIDMEFVRDLVHNKTDERLVRGIVGLAREFRLTTVAEGIEDEQTLAKLRELGVQRGQGYLFAQPTPVYDSEPASVGANRSRSNGCDPVAMVREAFSALDQPRIGAALALFHSELVLRVFETAKRADHAGAYRGHEGLVEYHRDVKRVWDELRITPSAFWETDVGIVVFGRVLGRSQSETVRADAMWVCRFRDGRIATVDVFKSPDSSRLPITRSP